MIAMDYIFVPLIFMGILGKHGSIFRANLLACYIQYCYHRRSACFQNATYGKEHVLRPEIP